MSSIDPDRLFSIFDQTDEQIYIEHGVDDLLQDGITVIMGISQQITYYQILDTLYTKKQGQQYDKVRDQIKLNYFTKLYSQLLKVDIQDTKQQVNTLESQDKSQCISGLQHLLQFFEQVEHYEKCSAILKAINKLNN